MKPLFLLLALLFATATVRASSLLEGVVYLKTGEQLRFTDADRIELPRKQNALRTFRDVFRKTRRRTAYRTEEIDSVVVWHPRTPDRRHTFLPTRAGWCRIYFSTPLLRALIYSRKGYTIYAGGGTASYVRDGLLGSSAIELYLQRLPDGELQAVGRLNSKTTDLFRRRIADFVADDPELAGRILRSNTSRDKTVGLLTGYHPSPNNP